MRRTKPKPPAGNLSSVFLVAGIALFIAGITLTINGTTNKDPLSHDYDYVIVGGGAAGSMLARRLSESGRHSVLVIEAGHDEDEDEGLALIGYWSRILPSFTMGRYFWQHTQERQRFGSRLGSDQEFARGIPPPSEPTLPAQSNIEWQYSSGRILGGNSKVNTGQFIRGTDWFFDRVANLTGDPMWSSTNVVQFYQDLEKYYSGNFNPFRRGFDGPLTVTDQNGEFVPMAFELMGALQQLTNLSQLDDYNDMFAASRLGSFVGWQMTVDANQTRTSADVAILTRRVRDRKNLDITTASTATKIIFDSKKHARGVTYLKNGYEHVAHARKRVILAAGINTPTLLQLSGVGPEEVLLNAGIPIVQNNSNVGRHLVNHLKITTTFLKDTNDFPAEEPATVYEGGAFLPDPNNNPFPVRSPRQFQLQAVNNFDEMFLSLINLQPVATGVNELVSKDPLHVSSVNQVTDDDDGDYDINMLAEGVRHYACKLHEEFQGYGHGPAIDNNYRLIDPPLEICNNTAELRDWVTFNMDPRVYQWTSSCRMGEFNDGESVTNSRGSVWGVTGLTVADRTLIPIPHDGDTTTLSYLIGSIIAEQIIGENF